MSSVNAAPQLQIKFIIEPMTEHDLLEVVEIEETSGLSRWGWDGYHEELARVIETVMLVAHIMDDATNGGKPEQRLAGFLAARTGAGELHINNVAVREIYRRKGIGAALLERALRVGSARGARLALLEVRAANASAQSLYRRQGFRITGQRKNYYAEPLDDALLMSAEI